ncbi:serine/threonine-protein kinase [Paraliomyxa miuraensis]|uniref:serine/threonine-protein kinase n=1 Tax=Paraliomyxa miuraensis TaxID=376150 RepID=UPI0022591243|nr:serine/threonine-protein kinase [Paraliomyxa miuraensis]MCX4246929.1 protein kinase [Paraliomyxa miuraensis]
MVGKPHEIETLAEGESVPRAQPDAEPEPAPGDLFADRYRIERRIGRGSMGTVLAAHDTVVDERVALKLLVASSAHALERFRREVRLARKVTHRNAARTFDLGEHQSRSFITMELVDGESLRQQLDRRPVLSVRDTVDLALQLCWGLDAAHEVGVVHRDLKPGNVLVEPGGRAVITDFGVAFSTVAPPAAGSGADATLDPNRQTVERAPMSGTPAYMAPEQVLGLAQDGRTDLFALGVMLFEMLTGQVPWTGDGPIEVAMARMMGTPPDPRTRAKLPDSLAELVLQCLAREPDHRPPSAAAVAERLETLRTRIQDEPGGAASGEASSSTGTLFASTAIGKHTLAVMPFRYHGPPDEAYLADALTDELIDLLAMTRGLRVSASGATQRYRDERDARTMGRALGVGSVIDGTVQRSGPEVRIVARLVEVDTGFQRWSERFAGPLEDVFELQDRMAKRVAEALRVELSLHDGTRASGEAIEQYLRGRAMARDPDVTGAALELAIACFERAHAASPSFVLPLAAIADATVRRWFVARTPDGEHWAKAARTAVARALDGAPHVAETHEAAARLEVNRGNFRAAAQHLDSALRIAPTCAAAHEYLGLLQCDGGRSREGVQHLRLAQELDPTIGLGGGTSMLRYHALRGDYDRFDELLERMRASPIVPRFVINLFEVRVALWRGDLQRARAVRWPESLPGQAQLVFEPCRMVLDDTVTNEALSATLDVACGQAASPRLRTTWRQLAVELLAWRGATALALRALALADEDGLLVDADWLERCPVLEPLATEPEFVEIRERVRQRADDIWRVAPGQVR